jgi:hypothetical protein
MVDESRNFNLRTSLRIDNDCYKERFVIDVEAMPLGCPGKDFVNLFSVDAGDRIEDALTLLPKINFIMKRVQVNKQITFWRDPKPDADRQPYVSNFESDNPFCLFIPYTVKETGKKATADINSLINEFVVVYRELQTMYPNFGLGNPESLKAVAEKLNKELAFKE